MQIHAAYANTALRFKTKNLLGRIFNPLVGILPELGFANRDQFGSRIFMSWADLTGTHLLTNTKAVKKGSHHIGGSGIFLEEALIKALAESIERYAQVTAEIANDKTTIYASYQDLCNRGEKVLAAEKLDFFSPQQLQRDQFPFQAFDNNAPLAWTKILSVFSNEPVWVPSQLLWVGHVFKKSQKEPWLAPAVTTGTATHENHISAIKSALLEIIQIDAAMGHWYGNHQAIEIIPDQRNALFLKIYHQYAATHKAMPKFYWLKNADLPGFAIACILDRSNFPRIALGLGCDMQLTSAMYKAYLEACSIAQFTEVAPLQAISETSTTDLHNFFDLDSNVEFYAHGGNAIRIEEKFYRSPQCMASELPPDDFTSTAEQVKILFKSFKNSGKELFYMDLTPSEAKALGLVVARIWSPDTISLALPSAVPIEHQRFKAYGGIAHDDPHPYP